MNADDDDNNGDDDGTVCHKHQRCTRMHALEQYI